MESYQYLLFIAFILISTKLFGIAASKLNMPQVVGALMAGIVLGPSMLNLVSLHGNEGILLSGMSEIGVIILMFTAGLSTDVKELKKNSVSAMVVAGVGVLVPIIGGFIAYATVFSVNFTDQLSILKAIFVGVILSATSVSITVETLSELGKLRSTVGTTILGAAVIDDILGIIVLTIVCSLQDTSVHIGVVLLKIVAFFVFIGFLFLLIRNAKKVLNKYTNHIESAIFAFAFCLILAYISETVFGIADITGAYFAGLLLCTLDMNEFIGNKVETASVMIFSPIFFASIGLNTTLTHFKSDILLFTVLLVVIAVLSKVIGCGLGAKMCGFSSLDSLQIGVGMISRGEVALIVAQKGAQYGILSKTLFAPVVLVVIVTTLVTPILLKIVMTKNETTLAKHSLMNAWGRG